VVNLKQRISALERANCPDDRQPLIVFCHDGVITPEQQLQIAEAEKAGRPIKKINTVVVPETD